MPKVEVYKADWCGFSHQARSLLEKKGIEYDMVDVDNTPGARDEMQKRGGGRTIPQIFIDGTPIGGCDELYALEQRGELDRLFKPDS